ncbi:hypothetical protein QR98_0091210, partial [Sarcoptes scabiei]
MASSHNVVDDVDRLQPPPQRCLMHPHGGHQGVRSGRSPPPGESPSPCPADADPTTRPPAARCGYLHPPTPARPGCSSEPTSTTPVPHPAGTGCSTTTGHDENRRTGSSPWQDPTRTTPQGLPPERLSGPGHQHRETPPGPPAHSHHQPD